MFRFMRELFKNIGNDKVILGSFSLTFILIFISFIYIIVLYNTLPPYIPLFNQLPWGYERLGTTIMVFLPTVAVVIIAIGNSILSSIIYRKTQIVSRMLAATSLLIAFLSFLFIVRTIQLVL